jgi:hypothetical protein
MESERRVRAQPDCSPYKGKQVALGERVRFGMDNVDACTEILYDLNVERLEIKQGQLRPNELYEKRTYGR